MATSSPIVRYDRLPTPVGTVLVAATERGVCRLEIGMAEREFVSSTKERYHCWVMRDEAFMAPYARQLREYFDGSRRRFDMGFDFLEGTTFQKKVWNALATVPFGQVRSYKWLAEKVGSSHGYRAVGAGKCTTGRLGRTVCHRADLHCCCVLLPAESASGYKGSRCGDERQSHCSERPGRGDGYAGSNGSTRADRHSGCHGNQHAGHR